MSEAATPPLADTVREIARRARAASLDLAVLDTAGKNRFLETLADRIESASDRIIAENAVDLDRARESGLRESMVERLTLTPERIAAMAEGTRKVAQLPDPVGAEVARLDPPRGFDLRKIRVPIGVVGIIYESRPNVTVDCAILCLKSGNASILRGGKEAFNSNRVLGELITATLRECGLPEAAVQVIPTTDRAALNELLKLDEYIHCIIPRGGEALIRFTVENSRIPVIKHYTGVCSLYVHAAADPGMAESITVNAKCQRPSVCNAIENLLVDSAVAGALLPRLAGALHREGVELRADPGALAVISAAGIPVTAAAEDDWGTEYNDRILSVALVDGVDAAVGFINTHGSGHSDAIVTADGEAAARFLAGVDSATVYHNASTRFTDGFEFGMGAEIGISTDRLHARGPMALEELCTYKYVIHGSGEIK